MTRLTWIGVALCLATGTPTAQAEDKPVALIKEWRGSVADATLAEGAPTLVASSTAWEKLWADWKLGEAPKVDFTKQLVLIATTRGSNLGLSCTLSDAGDLKVLARSTADFGDGFRYVMATVSREGVKTIDGRPLPED